MLMARAGFIAASAGGGLRTTSSKCRQALSCSRRSTFCLHPQSLHQFQSTQSRTSYNRRRHFSVIVAQEQPQQQTTLSPKVAVQSREWNPVKVVENSEACEDHRYIVVQVGIRGETDTCCDAYRFPGMYVKFRGGDSKEIYLAMACAPNIQGYFEFLVKESGGNRWFCDAQKGDVVEMSPVMGKGFGKIDATVSDVLLFATGSGIAPIRASIESFLNGVNPKGRNRCILYYGARYPTRMAFKDRLGLWEDDGVTIKQVMSRPGEDGIEWGGRTGYVQKYLQKDGVKNPDKTAALLCGVKGMSDEVTKILTEAGVPRDRILSNY